MKLKVPHAAWILSCCTQQDLWQNMPRRCPKSWWGLQAPSSGQDEGQECRNSSGWWLPGHFRMKTLQRNGFGTNISARTNFSTCFMQRTGQEVAVCVSGSLFIFGIIASYGSGDIPTSHMPSCFIQLSSYTANDSTPCLCTWLSNLWSYKRLSSVAPVFNSPSLFLPLR